MTDPNPLGCPVLISSTLDPALYQFYPGYKMCVDGAAEASLPVGIAWLLEYFAWGAVLAGTVKGIEWVVGWGNRRKRGRLDGGV